MSAHRKSEQGFSVIEVLVAVAIIGLLATTVSLAGVRDRDPVRLEAERLVVRLRQAEQEAVVTGRPVGVMLVDSGYEFTRYVDGQWRPLSDHPTLLSHAMDPQYALRSDQVRLAWRPGGVVTYPEIAFDPSGLTDPFRLELNGPDSRFAILLDDTGELRVEALDG